MDENFLVKENDKKSEFRLRFGILRWRPNCLQRFNSIKWFMIPLSLFAIAQGTLVNGFVNVSIPSLEKEFGFDSKMSGIIVAANDASALAIVGLVSFFGAKGNKPKIISVGAFITSIGALVFALPKLIKGTYHPKVLQGLSSELCLTNSTLHDQCATHQASESTALYVAIFFIGNFIMGAGTTPLYTLGPAYLDENVSPRLSPIYLGIWFATIILGPGLGFATGGLLLTIYTNIQQSGNVQVLLSDPAWVGAWWLGFVSFTGIFLLAGFMLLCFPSEISEGRAQRNKAIQAGHLPESDSSVEYTIKGYVLQSLKILTNKVFMFSVLGLTVKTLYGVSLATFIAKLLVLKFGLLPHKAGLVIGAVIAPTMVGGIMIGSCVMRKLTVKIAARNAAKYCFIGSVITALFSPTFLLPGCNTTNLAGVVVPYKNRTETSSLNSRCNLNCHCDKNDYNPVCGADGITYHSPCYAGCQTLNKTHKKVAHYKNCRCIENTTVSNLWRNASNTALTIMKKEVNGANATPGKCNRDCKNQYLFFFITILSVTLSFITGTPHKIVVLRCVPDNQRAFALGMQFLIMRSLSFLPGPIIMGSVLDSECIVWAYDGCGKPKNCLDYNIDNLSLNLVLLSLITSVVGSILYFLTWWYFKEPTSSTTLIADES